MVRSKLYVSGKRNPSAPGRRDLQGGQEFPVPREAQELLLIHETLRGKALGDLAHREPLGDHDGVFLDIPVDELPQDFPLRQGPGEFILAGLDLLGGAVKISHGPEEKPAPDETLLVEEIDDLGEGRAPRDIHEDDLVVAGGGPLEGAEKPHCGKDSRRRDERNDPQAAMAEKFERLHVLVSPGTRG